LAAPREIKIKDAVRARASEEFIDNNKQQRQQATTTTTTTTTRTTTSTRRRTTTSLLKGASRSALMHAFTWVVASRPVVVAFEGVHRTAN
jgi:hypothetical protein